MSFVNSHTGTGHRCPTTTTGERKKKRERERERERSKEKNIIGTFYMNDMVYGMVKVVQKLKVKIIFYFSQIGKLTTNNGYGKKILKTCRHPR